MKKITIEFEVPDEVIQELADLKEAQTEAIDPNSAYDLIDEMQRLQNLRKAEANLSDEARLIWTRARSADVKTLLAFELKKRQVERDQKTPVIYGEGFSGDHDIIDQAIQRGYKLTSIGEKWHNWEGSQTNSAYDHGISLIATNAVRWLQQKGWTVKTEDGYEIAYQK